MRAVTLQRITLVAVVLALTAGARANLLVNGGFEEGGAAPCVTGWRLSNATQGVTCKYDATTHAPNPGVMEGLHRGSTDVNTAGPAESHIIQTVTVAVGQQVRLTGWIAGGTTGPVYTYFARIRDGANLAAPVLAAFETTNSGWQRVDIVGIPTTTSVTVEWGFSGPALNWGIVTVHADGFELTQANPVCTGEPTITGVSQEYGVTDTTVTGVQLAGTNFDSTCEVFLRGTGLPEIQATNVVAGAGGNTLTFDLPLTGAPMGKRNIVVTKANCNGTTLNNGFLVILPALTNGSFELPAAGGSSCPNPPTVHAPPTHWLQTGTSTGTDHFKRDSALYPPGCPRPDGEHYASVEVPIGVSFASWSVYQHVAVTPHQPITVSGQFAGGGRTTVDLIIRDGDESGPELASQTIERRKGCPIHIYDWVFAAVSATPTKPYITVVWRTAAQMNEWASIDVIHASHADNLVLAVGPPPVEICGNGIDDDGDRRTDCQDPDCAAASGCTPPPVEICGDSLDNDGDLDIDCDDPDCAASCGEICNNGQDDDGDCKIDEDCTEICDNELDDNGNGLIDCADPECWASPLCGETCDNGIDDNNNGRVDCYDSACAEFPACKCHDPVVDYDGDGDVDMVDFAMLQRCRSTTAVFSQACRCLDTDGDGDVDEAELVSLILCASGPEIPADPSCD
ncbi:MAG TPA: hypothetical protein PL151_08145 [Phycisphaerae bacterium]|nr:hypothetical protein [Phycisphaerae bacterium]HOJ75636.1 hypothetical protein [Phycisphaerae bacterium]HOM52504.1 hypothetical protein [Phycisphaerae bacterium]HON65353.1 hypothetical protein [Phycisphaerae bacterium]HOQ85346.1 hypothetical protein [Phycisphaerae bacterium]